MPKDDGKYTIKELVEKVGDLTHAQGEVNKYAGLAATAKAAFDSHQRDLDKALEVLDKRKAEVRKIADNLER